MLEVKKVKSFREYGLVAYIRTQVFISEQQCPAIDEFDAQEESADHYLGFFGSDPVVTCRVLFPETGLAKIGRIATLREYRGKGYASDLLRQIIGMIENKDDISEIQMSAQDHAIGLYEKFGFKVKGEGYIEDGLPHRLMTKELNEEK